MGGPVIEQELAELAGCHGDAAVGGGHAVVPHVVVDGSDLGGGVGKAVAVAIGEFHAIGRDDGTRLRGGRRHADQFGCMQRHDELTIRAAAEFGRRAIDPANGVVDGREGGRIGEVALDEDVARAFAARREVLVGAFDRLGEVGIRGQEVVDLEARPDIEGTGQCNGDDDPDHGKRHRPPRRQPGDHPTDRPNPVGRSADARARRPALPLCPAVPASHGDGGCDGNKQHEPSDCAGADRRHDRGEGHREAADDRYDDLTDPVEGPAPAQRRAIAHISLDGKQSPRPDLAEDQIRRRDRDRAPDTELHDGFGAADRVREERGDRREGGKEHGAEHGRHSPRVGGR